jgi:hypothetical protein
MDARRYILLFFSFFALLHCWVTGNRVPLSVAIGWLDQVVLINFVTHTDSQACATRLVSVSFVYMCLELTSITLQLSTN